MAVAIAINIQVRRLGFTVFRYEHTNNELWRDGQLVSLESKTFDDGDDEFASVRRNAGALVIDGSGYKGDAPANSAPTSYWNYETVSRPQWFSSQSGKLLNLTITQRDEGGLERVDLTGDFNNTLFYDADKEWRGCRFNDKRGVSIIYRQTAAGQAFSPLV